MLKKLLIIVMCFSYAALPTKDDLLQHRSMNVKRDNFRLQHESNDNFHSTTISYGSKYFEICFQSNPFNNNLTIAAGSKTKLIIGTNEIGVQYAIKGVLRTAIKIKNKVWQFGVRFGFKKGNISYYSMHHQHVGLLESASYKNFYINNSDFFKGINEPKLYDLDAFLKEFKE
jgi:hypothetical protein